MAKVRCISLVTKLGWPVAAALTAQLSLSIRSWSITPLIPLFARVFNEAYALPSLCKVPQVRCNSLTRTKAEGETGTAPASGLLAVADQLGFGL